MKTKTKRGMGMGMGMGMIGKKNNANKTVL